MIHCPILPGARRCGDVQAGHAYQRDRKQRAQHPGDRRAQKAAAETSGRANREGGAKAHKARARIASGALGLRPGQTLSSRQRLNRREWSLPAVGH